MTLAAISERVTRFYAVGLMGVAVQLAALCMLTGAFGIQYMISTVIAVEIAVIHNFFWHERWTWRSRTSRFDCAAGQVQRFCKFHLSTGVISILTNVVATGALVEVAGMQYLIANSFAIAIGSVATYVSGDLFVFRESRH